MGTEQPWWQEDANSDYPGDGVTQCACGWWWYDGMGDNGGMWYQRVGGLCMTLCGGYFWCTHCGSRMDGHGHALTLEQQLQEWARERGCTCIAETG